MEVGRKTTYHYIPRPLIGPLSVQERGFRVRKKMNTEFDPFITKFSDIFEINFQFNNNIFLNSKVSISPKFKAYLKKLNKSEVTILYKLSNLTNSIILSFFFMKKKISCKRLFKLVNIEYNYQQKRWGVLKEHKLNNVFLENERNVISTLYRNIITLNAF